MSNILKVCDASEEFVTAAIGCEGFDDVIQSVIDALYQVLDNTDNYNVDRGRLVDTLAQFNRLKGS